MIPIKLTEHKNHTSIPCRTYRDADGNLYWRNFIPDDVGTKEYGRLFKGTAGDKSEFANLVYEIDGLAFNNSVLDFKF